MFGILCRERIFTPTLQHLSTAGVPKEQPNANFLHERQQWLCRPSASRGRTLALATKPERGVLAHVCRLQIKK